MKKIANLVMISLTIFFTYSSFLLIMGGNYQMVSKSSGPLFGKVIFIDAGHGGKDDGAHYNNVLEDEVNLQISKLLYEELFNDGAIVLTSRVGDYDLADLYANNRKMSDLKKRATMINEGNVDLFVSVHLNAFHNSNVSGAQVFYRRNDKNSFDLSASLQEQLNELNKKNKVSKNGDYFLLESTTAPGVIVECGFLSNLEESKKLKEVAYQKKVVSLIKKGIEIYFNK